MADYSVFFLGLAVRVGHVLQLLGYPQPEGSGSNSSELGDALKSLMSDLSLPFFRQILNHLESQYFDFVNERLKVDFCLTSGTFPSSRSYERVGDDYQSTSCLPHLQVSE